MKLINADCIQAMREMAENSIDSIVTDPPYELGFMGKKWDSSGIAFNVEVWQQALRVLKPGGHLLAFSGSRTYHRMVVAIEDAGFEIRDQIMWIYGSGFPKSHDVSKAIDKAAGAERQVIREKTYELTDGGGYSGNLNTSKPRSDSAEITAPSTPEAQQWQGWGTALKPAHEPIVVARKPLTGTVAENVLEHGVGGLNIDGCRIAGEVPSKPQPILGNKERVTYGGGLGRNGEMSQSSLGRWPANIIFDEQAAELLDEQSDNVSRFFYCAKASKRDRNEGLEGLPIKQVGTYAQDEWSRKNMGNTPDAERKATANFHPTVKPTSLMRYLVRLVTPPKGLVLDPFMGSGSTGKACALEHFDFVGIELNAEYIKICKARIENALQEKEQQQELF
jgi:DNA modification methylase